MLSKDPSFRKVKIKARGAFGSASYWLGPDHLMIVLFEGYKERYRRIDYKDIQAITIRQTSAWILVMILIALALVGGGLLPMLSGTVEGLAIGGVVTTIFVIVLVAHLIAGPSCKCRIVTAVQNRDLPHINRWKAAGRLLEELQVEINRVQRRPVAAEASPDTGEPTAQTAAAETIEPASPSPVEPAVSAPPET